MLMRAQASQHVLAMVEASRGSLRASLTERSAHGSPARRCCTAWIIPLPPQHISGKRCFRWRVEVLDLLFLPCVLTLVASLLQSSDVSLPFASSQVGPGTGPWCRQPPSRWNGVAHPFAFRALPGQPSSSWPSLLAGTITAPLKTAAQRPPPVFHQARHGRMGGVPLADAVATDSTEVDKVSPFESQAGIDSKTKLPLTWENVEVVLDEVRPYLRGDGGDCRIVEIVGPVVRLELQGSCSSCSSSSVTLKMGIERTLMERIPEIDEVSAVMPDQEPLSREGVEEVLNGIRPFLSVSGGTIDLSELDENSTNSRLVLQMTGPPLRSTAVKVEVANRIKRKYPTVQDVVIVGSEDRAAEPSLSA
mmetsp:Transcript_2182/g.4989  ORF Transcript_2182/g.4989 Transcript_2182/m.4989 type:complete len:362 (-) Transcript_2182:198-1283(-)